ncbi:hypothetical protein P174DRAFT_464833 [Aspergillus novofumigatus IBT 16806]|uniref:Uncharacterized protein n=5 Tax=Aspergillus TaxID=5052 RepID=A0A2I1BUU2_ASPN1|nr:hypothetical protein P174DRAFT_464833 [Aspergillus novofumigatus IBT 16806]
MEPFPTSVLKFIRPVSCYTLLSGFRLPWPPSGCLDELTPFVVSDERAFRHLNLAFGSSRIASSAYQKWPTSCFNPKASNHSLYLIKLIRSFAPIPKFDDRFARQNRCEPPPEFPLASPYSGIVHHLSGPHSYAHVRLLGPCFKTGHLRPLRQLWSQTLPFQQFHVLFNSLFKVLFIFRSLYLCAIGLRPVFSFR